MISFPGRSPQPEFLRWRNQRSDGVTADARMDWFSSHGRMGSHWHGMSRSPPRLADSYVNASANSAGGAAEMAASRKSAKYADLPASYIFQLIALETLGPMNSSAMEFFTVLVSDERERGGGAFFFSRYPTQFCCTRVSLESTIRTSSSSRFFRFNFFSF